MEIMSPKNLLENPISGMACKYREIDFRTFMIGGTVNQLNDYRSAMMVNEYSVELGQLATSGTDTGIS